MKKHLLKLVMILTLAVVICLPGMASADYVQSWVENGLYQGTYQTWDTAEAFLHSAGTWTGTGLTDISAAGWTVQLINPQYALATGPTYVSSPSESFYFTTHATDLTGNFSFDWVLSYQGITVGVYNLTGTPSGGWTGTEYNPANPPDENRSHVPIPPSMLLLGSGLLGLVLLCRRKTHEP
jgi:hypothetical protein